MAQLGDRMSPKVAVEYRRMINPLVIEARRSPYFQHVLVLMQSILFVLNLLQTEIANFQDEEESGIKALVGLEIFVVTP